MGDWDESGVHAGGPVLSLVYAEGHRPDAAAIDALSKVSSADLAFSVSYDPGERLGWLELLAMGLAFDCNGLAPAAPAVPPLPGVLLGLEGQPAGESIALTPGPHLVSGRALMPVVRTLAGLGSRLAELPGVVAVSWLPARSWMEPGYFRGIVADWLGGGAFPALGLTTLHRQDDGTVVSMGLRYFIGQELTLAAGTELEPALAAQLAIRLINDLVLGGPLREPIEVPGPAGIRLAARPRPDGAMVLARIC